MKVNKRDPELPPFASSWRKFYRLLIYWLILLIVLFYLFTQYYK
ncbi:hypothetical protein SAMN04488084_106213 [Pedobacter antarcticus]|nr:hypothetical protein SAMN04488084_106213 [Pedobacter antarcticus]